MKFGEFGVGEAEGLLLAHSLRLPGGILKKGRRVTGADVSRLEAAGIARIHGARLEEGDLGEDEAAAAVASMIAGGGLEARAAHTGRCNLHAASRGLFDVDAERIERINAVDEAVTVATLPRQTAVRAGAVVATVKVIPLAVGRETIERCRDAAGRGGVFTLKPFAAKRVALIVSEQLGDPPKNFVTAVNSSRRRIEDLGSHLGLVQRCPHQRDFVTRALRETLASGCDLLLVSGATVPKDRSDTIPSAIVAAGGVIERFGMPVEPGNMLLLGHIGAVPVIILPGCARSRRLNGLDWVLQRMLAGMEMGDGEIGRMGVGGLIRSAAEAEDDEEATDTNPQRSASGCRIAALVLAAGAGTRMGGGNKLLCEVDGVPMVRRAVNAALASRCITVQVVTGHQAEEVESALTGLAVECLRNPRYSTGMASSLRAGLAALPEEADAVIIVLADMPHVDGALIDRLIAAWNPLDPRIIAPARGGRRGNPILWPRALVAEMAQVEGDVGARALLQTHAERVSLVEWENDAIFADVDTPDALRAAQAQRAAK